MIRPRIHIACAVNQQYGNSQRCGGSDWTDCGHVEVPLRFGHAERLCDNRTRQKPRRPLRRNRSKIGKGFRRDHGSDSLIDGRALNRHGGAK